MTPLYDVLTAQPSLDADQISRRRFKLAMSVGDSRHYAVHDIVPRHFLQTAEKAGVGTPAMIGIFEEIAASAVRQAEAVVTALPKGFPAQLVDSTLAALADRTRLVEAALARGAEA